MTTTETVALVVLGLGVLVFWGWLAWLSNRRKPVRTEKKTAADWLLSEPPSTYFSSKEEVILKVPVDGSEVRADVGNGISISARVVQKRTSRSSEERNGNTGSGRDES